MSQDFSSPISLAGQVNASYEHSNRTKHEIIEYRSDEFTICKPKKIVHKRHWYSRQRLWLVHYIRDGEVDIRELDKDEI